MTLGIMQPYLFPYIGYFQLINAVDRYIVYDNIQYTKKGWINRNRILINGVDSYITLPLEKGSDYLDIRERTLAESFERKKMIAQIRGAYCKAPFFKEVFPLIEGIISCDEQNLFLYLYNSIISICRFLDIETTIVVSSQIDIDHSLKGEDKVLSLCRSQNAQTYINAIGGLSLYSKEKFGEQNIELKFLQSDSIVYNQFENTFVPFLSIIDVLMFNGKTKTKEILNNYILV